MDTYSGRLWLVQDPGSGIDAEISVVDERIRVTSNDVLIGDWAFEEIVALCLDGALHLSAEDEELVFDFHRGSFIPMMLEAVIGGSEVVSPDTDRVPSMSKGVTVDFSRDVVTVKPDPSEGRFVRSHRRRSRKGAHRAPWRMKLRW